MIYHVFYWIRIGRNDWLDSELFTLVAPSGIRSQSVEIELSWDENEKNMKKCWEKEFAFKFYNTTDDENHENHENSDFNFHHEISV